MGGRGSLFQDYLSGRLRLQRLSLRPTGGLWSDLLTSFDITKRVFSFSGRRFSTYALVWSNAQQIATPAPAAAPTAIPTPMPTSTPSPTATPTAAYTRVSFTPTPTSTKPPTAMPTAISTPVLPTPTPTEMMAVPEPTPTPMSAQPSEVAGLPALTGISIAVILLLTAVVAFALFGRQRGRGG